MCISPVYIPAIPPPAFTVNFDTGESNPPAPLKLRNGATGKDGASGVVSKALRIDCDGPYVVFPNLDISPSTMPEVLVIIKFFLKRIPKGSKSWLLDLSNNVFNCGLVVLNDSRFNGIFHCVGYPDGPVYNIYAVPEVGKWIQMVVTYHQEDVYRH